MTYSDDIKARILTSYPRCATLADKQALATDCDITVQQLFNVACRLGLARVRPGGA